MPTQQSANVTMQKMYSNAFVFTLYIVILCPVLRYFASFTVGLQRIHLVLIHVSLRIQPPTIIISWAPKRTGEAPTEAKTKANFFIFCGPACSLHFCPAGSKRPRKCTLWTGLCGMHPGHGKRYRANICTQCTTTYFVIVHRVLL